jgi:hypothetical protein
MGEVLRRHFPVLNLTRLQWAIWRTLAAGVACWWGNGVPGNWHGNGEKRERGEMGEVLLRRHFPNIMLFS